jgi:hypothetical protein
LSSAGPRFEAKLTNASVPPSRENTGPPLRPFPLPVPDASLDTSVVVPVARSCRNTSPSPFVSVGSRLVAALVNATLVPSGDRTEVPTP